MKITLFLTSSPCLDNGELNPANGFIDSLSLAVRRRRKALFISSSPHDFAFTDRVGNEIFTSLRSSNIEFASYAMLDWRNAEQARELVEQSDLIVLSGGHVPTQNKFFREINLREIMHHYHGVVMGISAGTMNSANVVYAQPELEGEGKDRNYKRFLKGLGLTKIMIIPHFNSCRYTYLDGMRLIEDIAVPDSYGNQFFALPDGSYLYSKNGKEEIRGEAYLISEGNMTQVCEDGKVCR